MVKEKLEQTEVERVSSTRQKDRLHIYLFSRRLILNLLASLMHCMM